MIVFRFFISTTDDPHGTREQEFASPYGGEGCLAEAAYQESFDAAR